VLLHHCTTYIICIIFTNISLKSAKIILITVAEFMAAVKLHKLATCLGDRLL